jgi:hypothetical protein
VGGLLAAEVWTRIRLPRPRCEHSCVQ